MRAALAVPFAVFLIVYAPAVGHGFISDDFRWILESRIQHPSEVVDLFSRHTGFYRPAVALTFAADFALFGNQPLPAALFGSSLWLLNLHGMMMALLWISGRTAINLRGSLNSWAG